MVPIKIDISDLAIQMQLSVEKYNDLSVFILDRLTKRFSQLWESEVKNSLDSTRMDYLRAMSFERVSDGEAVFELKYSKDNPLPVMIEDGATPFDIKEGFKKSPKRKHKVDGGWYITVPFRHASSQVVVSTHSFSSTLPKEVESLAKASPTPLKRGQLPIQHQSPARRPEINRLGIKVPEYKHKSAKYEGLQRKNISSTANENRGGYFTFRRVSDKSDPNSWWHKGFDAHKFMEKAVNKMNVNSIVNKAIDDFFNV